MMTKTALLKTVDIFVDVATIHVTLHFEYSDGTQQAGPYDLTNKLLRDIACIADEREVFKIKDKPCRVHLKPINTMQFEIVSIGHFLRDDWFPLQ
jgi:hypothetical protein